MTCVRLSSSSLTAASLKQREYEAAPPWRVLSAISAMISRRKQHQNKDLINTPHNTTRRLIHIPSLPLRTLQLAGLQLEITQQ